RPVAGAVRASRLQPMCRPAGLRTDGEGLIRSLQARWWNPRCDEPHGDIFPTSGTRAGLGINRAPTRPTPMNARPRHTPAIDTSPNPPRTVDVCAMDELDEDRLHALIPRMRQFA